MLQKITNEHIKPKRNQCMFSSQFPQQRHSEIKVSVHSGLSTSATSFETVTPFVFRVLILAPVSVVYNWSLEFKRWLPVDYAKNMSNKLTFYVTAGGSSRGDDRHNLKCWENKGGVCIMGYEQFVSYQSQDDLKKVLENPGPDIVVLDEAHRIKDDSSKLYKALVKIRTKRRIALTGSPLQNNLLEYFHMVNFVKHNHLLKKGSFIKNFVDPIKEGESADATPFAKKKMKGRLHVLTKKLASIVDRKDISHLKRFLQPKREFVLLVKLTPFQQYLYKRFLYIIKSKCGGQGRNIKSDFAKKGHLFSHAKAGMLIWGHPLCLPMNDFLNKADPKQRGSSTHSFPTISSLAGNLSDMYQACIQGKGTFSYNYSEDDALSKVVNISTTIKSEKDVFGDTDIENNISSVKAQNFFEQKNKSQETINLVEEDTDNDDEMSDVVDEMSDWWRNQVGRGRLDNAASISGLSSDNILRLGNKMIMFLTILTEAIKVGDKVVLFSQVQWNA